MFPLDQMSTAFSVLPGLVQFGFPVVVAIIGYRILRRSAKANEERFWAQRYQQKNPPTHEVVDNQPSLGAWIATVLFVISACYVFGWVVLVLH